jgi:hypothetical protein
VHVKRAGCGVVPGSLDRGTHVPRTAGRAARKARTTSPVFVLPGIARNLKWIVRRILRKYGYPPDKREKATRTVLEQAEQLGEAWAV